MTYSVERTRGTGIFCCLFIQRFMMAVTEQNPHMTEQQAYLYSFTNRLKEQFVWFILIVRLPVCRVCMFDHVCITMGVPGDCCLCFSIYLVVPSTQLMRWEFLSANPIIPR